MLSLGSKSLSTSIWRTCCTINRKILLCLLYLLVISSPLLLLVSFENLVSKRTSAGEYIRSETLKVCFSSVAVDTQGNVVFPFLSWPYLFCPVSSTFIVQHYCSLYTVNMEKTCQKTTPCSLTLLNILQHSLQNSQNTNYSTKSHYLIIICIMHLYIHTSYIHLIRFIARFVYYHLSYFTALDDIFRFKYPCHTVKLLSYTSCILSKMNRKHQITTSISDNISSLNGLLSSLPSILL